MSARNNRQARDSASAGQRVQPSPDAAELGQLCRELGTLFSRLCAVAGAGAGTLASALDTPDRSEQSDLIVAAEMLFGMVGLLGELGVQACGDPGVRGEPATWLELGDGLAALRRLEGMAQRARVDRAAADVMAGSASKGGAA
jgi:hypothetical protein